MRAVFGGMAKLATEIDDAARVPEIVSRAFHAATGGRPGPVVIGLPKDMLTERVSVADTPAFEPGGHLARPAGDGEARRAARIRATPLPYSRRQPLVGAGARRRSRNSPNASSCLLRRATGALPLFDPLHPCYAGDLGIGPNPKLIARLKAADVVDRARRPARRIADARLHAVRYSSAAHQARAYPSRFGGARTHLQAASGDPRRADGVRRGAEGAAAAAEHSLA